MERFTTTLSQTYILGDMNLHLDNASDGYASKFISVLEACRFDQRVKMPTHRKGHTLDVLITQMTNANVSDIEVSDSALCGRNGNFSYDHYTVSCSINIPKPRPVKHTVQYRKLRSIDVQSFN